MRLKCVAVFKGDLPRLRRLLRAGADANGARLTIVLAVTVGADATGDI